MSRVVAFASWALLMGVGFGLLPPARPDQTEWVIRLLTGQWAGENPWVVVEFQLLGVWPFVMIMLLRADWRAKPVPAWPFLALAFVLGCYAALLWRVVARPAPALAPVVPRWAPLSLGVVVIGLVGWGVVAGDPRAWAATVVSDAFVWPMTWDFLAYWIWSAAEVRARGGGGWGLVPILGPLWWMARR